MACEKCGGRGWIPVIGENRGTECSCSVVNWYKISTLGKFPALSIDTITSIVHSIEVNNIVVAPSAETIFTCLGKEGWFKPTFVFGSGDVKVRLLATLVLFSKIKFHLSPSIVKLEEAVNMWVNEGASFAEMFKTRVCIISVGSETPNRGAVWTLNAAADHTSSKICSLFVFPSQQSIEALKNHYEKMAQGEFDAVIPQYNVIHLGSQSSSKTQVSPPPPVL